MAYESLIDQLNARSATFRQLVADFNAQEALIEQDRAATYLLRRRAETAADAIAARAASGTGTTTPTYKIKGLVVEGDSQSTITNGNPTPWPAQFGTLTGLPVLNYAQSSTTLAQMRDNYGANDHAGPHFNANSYNCLVIGSAGTNDLTNDATTVDDLKANIRILAGKGKTTGYITFVTTILPRGYDWSAAREAKRVEYNAWLIATASTFCDGCLDFAGTLTMADLYDLLHPNDGGSLKMATALKTRVTNTSSGTGTGTTVPGFAPQVVVGEGDSITQAYGTGSQGILGKWNALPGNTNATINNIAREGSQYRDIDDEYGLNSPSTGAVGPGTQFVAGKINALVLMIGTNDISNDNASLAAYKIHTQSLSTKARGTGYKFWLHTILRRGDATTNPSRETVRNQINAWILSGADGLIDGFINNENVAWNSTNFNDVVHPNETGNGLIGANMDAAFKGAAGTTTTTPSIPAASSSITTDGVIDMDKWAAMAAKMWTLEGVAYRFGDPSPNIPNRPTYYKPTTNTRWPENIVGTHSGTYQYGNFQTYEGAFQGGDFSSNIMWAPYVADDPANWIGLIELQANSTDHGTWAQEPELSWCRYGAGENAVEAVYWKVARGYAVQKAICSANTLDRPGWGTECVTFFQDGSFVSSGANTMTNKARGQLPAGLVPVACCVTGANGMCLVVCMDVPNKRGVLVPILLGGLGANSTADNPNQGDWWNEWVELHPGLHNLGNLVFMKPLGVFPLPGMVAPTGISATTHHSRNGYLDGSPGEPSCRNQTFNNDGGEARRLNWGAGKELERAYVKQAECIVISKVEQKALWIDLKPIYAYINAKYFGPNRGEYEETRNIGLNAGQWPYTLAERPQQTPTVTKTMTFDDQPTCVFMAPYSEREEWRQAGIGFRSGKVRIYNTGGVNDTGNANAKVEAFSFDIGFNPTKITWTKEKARKPSTQEGLVLEPTRHWQFCVRGEAAIKWVDLTSATTWKLRRVFQDSRLIDPVGLIDMDNHGAESYMTGVADCYGRGIATIRWGHTIAWTYPDQRRFRMGADGTAEFEWCGKFPVRGYPTDLNSANVS